jgi:thiosulfate/3-mercaptopyruvate sulfurtransferase
MALIINKPLVSVDWLHSNLENKNLIILDATIPKVTSKKDANSKKVKSVIKGAIFFDIKNVFSDKNSLFPNTVLSKEQFEVKAQEIGVNKNSCIVVYDDIGIYSSPRVWWMFQLMGFKNIAILDGGFPEWKLKQYVIESPQNNLLIKGDFEVDYKLEKLKLTSDMLSAIDNKSILIADARSKGRFCGIEPEPREDVKGGHIPNSVSFPFSRIVENGKMISENNMKKVFEEINPKKKAFIFSCGSGITASILAIGAELIGIKNHAVYDGSWTEWGSTDGLLIEK